MRIKIGLGRRDYKKQSNEISNFYELFSFRKRRIKLVKRITEGESCMNAIIGYKNNMGIRWVSISLLFCFIKIYY